MGQIFVKLYTDCVFGPHINAILNFDINFYIFQHSPGSGITTINLSTQ